MLRMELKTENVFDLPLLSAVNRFVRGLVIVSMEEPVREVKLLTSIYPDNGGLSEADGVVFLVDYGKGKTREVYVWGTGGHHNFDMAVFLKPGRSTDQMDEVIGLMIDDPKDPVPNTLKDLLRDCVKRSCPEQDAKLNFG